MQAPKSIIESSGISQPAALRLELGCAVEQVRPAAEAVRQFLRDHGCTEQEVMDCDLALVEACTNAVQYALPAARDLPVAVEILCVPREIELRITDHCSGFTWPEQARLPKPESESGRGVYLIQALMDQTSYLRQPEGNTLILRKRRSVA